MRSSADRTEPAFHELVERVCREPVERVPGVYTFGGMPPCRPIL